MYFSPTPLAGVFVIEAELREDERGFFARTWCANEAADHGIHVTWVQFNISLTKHRGTLRGMHYQHAPHAEGKLIRVTRGVIHDVVIDLRAESTTYKQHVASGSLRRTARAIHSSGRSRPRVPHSEDDTEVNYQMSAPYVPAAAAGVRWMIRHSASIGPSRFKAISGETHASRLRADSVSAETDVAIRSKQLGQAMHRLVTELYPICRALRQRTARNVAHRCRA